MFVFGPNIEYIQDAYFHASIYIIKGLLLNNNNFDGVRIGLALIVVFAHIQALTKLPELHFLHYFFDSDFAVKGFFAISGYLVTQSYLSSRHLSEYAEKRIRRIYPAYLGAILFGLLIAVFVSQLNWLDFLKATQTIQYFLSNLLFLNFIQPSLPGVFLDNPVHQINGALWTIKVEVMLYCCVPFIVFFFRKFGASLTTSVIYILSIVWVYYFSLKFSGEMGKELARQFPGQLSYFVAGAFLSMNEKVRTKTLSLFVLSCLLLIACKHPVMRILLQPVAYSCLVIYLAIVAGKGLNFGRYGDISFGIYLYHFPMIQLLIHLGLFQYNCWLGVALSILFTILVAFVSWHLVEKKVLKRNSHYIVAAQQ